MIGQRPKFDNSERTTDEFAMSQPMIYIICISYGPYGMDIDHIIWSCYWFQSQNKFDLTKELYHFLVHHDLRVYYLYELGFLTRDEQTWLKDHQTLCTVTCSSFNPVLDLGCDGDKSWFESLKGYHKLPLMGHQWCQKTLVDENPSHECDHGRLRLGYDEFLLCSASQFLITLFFAWILIKIVLNQWSQ